MDFSNRKYLKAESSNSVRTATFNEGDIIFRKGASGETMYEVMRGGVGIYLHYGEPNEVLLAEKFFGEFFGEIALLENRPRTATCVAIAEGTELREISANGFIHYIRQNPDNLKPIMDAMSDRFKEQRKQYFEACEALLDYKAAIEKGEEIDPQLQKAIDKYVRDGQKNRSK